TALASSVLSALGLDSFPTPRSCALTCANPSSGVPACQLPTSRSPAAVRTNTVPCSSIRPHLAGSDLAGVFIATTPDCAGAAFGCAPGRAPGRGPGLGILAGDGVDVAMG